MAGERKCVYCGGPIVGRISRAIFCSIQCKQKQHNGTNYERERDERLAMTAHERRQMKSNGHPLLDAFLQRPWSEHTQHTSKRYDGWG